MMDAPAARPFIPLCGSVVARMWTTLRARWGVLLIAGLVIFVPLGLIETIDASVQDALDDAEQFSLGDVLSVLGAGALHAVGSVFGEVLFAGVVTATVIDAHGGRRPSLRELLAELKLGRLALADVVYVLVVIAGLIALVVPGFVFMIWFALLGPVIEVEHLGVREAFRRSRELVRRRFWLVAAFVIPISLLEESLSDLAHEAGVSWLGDSFLGEWLGGALTGLVTSLPLALAVVVLYFELSGATRSSPRTRPPESPRSRPAASA